MVQDPTIAGAVRSAAKTEIKRREWASQRGKATRAFIREHTFLIDEFRETGAVTWLEAFPSHVTKAAVLFELRIRARRAEATKSVRTWKDEHPD